MNNMNNYQLILKKINNDFVFVSTSLSDDKKMIEEYDYTLEQVLNQKPDIGRSIEIGTEKYKEQQQIYILSTPVPDFNILVTHHKLNEIYQTLVQFIYEHPENMVGFELITNNQNYTQELKIYCDSKLAHEFKVLTSKITTLQNEADTIASINKTIIDKLFIKDFIIPKILDENSQITYKNIKEAIDNFYENDSQSLEICNDFFKNLILDEGSSNNEPLHKKAITTLLNTIRQAYSKANKEIDKNQFISQDHKGFIKDKFKARVTNLVESLLLAKTSQDILSAADNFNQSLKNLDLNDPYGVLRAPKTQKIIKGILLAIVAVALLALALYTFGGALGLAFTITAIGISAKVLAAAVVATVGSVIMAAVGKQQFFNLNQEKNLEAAKIKEGFTDSNFEEQKDAAVKSFNNG